MIKGLCAQIYSLRFEIIGGVRSQVLIFLFGRENRLKKQLVQDLILPLSICMYMCTLYTYTNIQCRDLVHPDSSGPPGVSSRLLGSHTSNTSVQCVCVRVLSLARNIVQAVVAACPTAVSTKTVAQCSLLKKSVQINASS